MGPPESWLHVKAAAHLSSPLSSFALVPAASNKRLVALCARYRWEQGLPVLVHRLLFGTRGQTQVSCDGSPDTRGAAVQHPSGLEHGFSGIAGFSHASPLSVSPRSEKQIHPGTQTVSGPISPWGTILDDNLILFSW